MDNNTGNNPQSTNPQYGQPGDTQPYNSQPYNAQQYNNQQYNAQAFNTQQYNAQQFNNMPQSNIPVQNAAPAKAPKKKNSKAASVLGIILLIGLAAFLIITSVVDLIGVSGAETLSSTYSTVPEKNSYVEATFHYCDYVGAMKHTINFIPVGTEYYYLVYTDDSAQAIFVRADKNFIDNFDNDGISYSGVTFSGKVREMDFDMEKEIRSTANEITAYGINVARGDDSSYLYIDARTTKNAVLNLIGFVAVVLAAVFLYIVSKMPADVPGEMSHQGKAKVFGILCAICFFAGAIIILHVLSTYK